MNPVLGGGGFHHVCVKTRDWEGTQRFYREVLGCTEKIAWRLRGTGHRAVMLDTGNGNYMEVFEDPEFAATGDGGVAHFALRTTRLDDVAERLRAAGVNINVEPKEITLPTTNGVGPVPIRIFFCEGPNGEVIEFFQNTLT
jgi:glyoxylase I family protein